MIVLETAQAVKFAETLQEALGRDPLRPKELEGLESLPQRVELIDASVDADQGDYRSRMLKRIGSATAEKSALALR